MSRTRIDGLRIAGISTCLPPKVVDNLDPALGFDPVEVRKVVSLAGIRQRHVVEPGVTSGDLCFQAARDLLAALKWDPASVSALIFVSQSPDHWLPSTSCLLQHRLGLGTDCAAFDVGLGCSGYPYGLYLAATMLKAGGHRRVLMLTGETPSRFVSREDHTTSLLFGDAGSATALELDEHAAPAWFCLNTDGAGAKGLVIPGGGFRDRCPADPRDLLLRMDGAAVFNFTIKRVPELVADTLAFSGLGVDELDAYILHQSNRFMMKHLIKKCGLDAAKVPILLEDMGNCGGPSVPVALTRALGPEPAARRRLMMLGYGVGLSWGSALMDIDADTLLLHRDDAEPSHP
jgi:3-oxoacyl-[acyl-carrier-protein] synthase III